uniref:Uncharacterized protein n=1 Tax=Lactuca sativa TaxID=4236 RepID=A0A9R1WYL1_LACSA|nr:hypothetical protein LSAT_V11C800406340 [Lactuca sativa]
MAPLYETLAVNSMLELDQKVLPCSIVRKLMESMFRTSNSMASSLLLKKMQIKRESTRTTEGDTRQKSCYREKNGLGIYTLQMGFFYMDFDLISRSIDKSKK